MIEQITSDNYREFSARYLGTIGFLKSKSNERLVVSVDEITAAAVVVSNHEGVSYRLNSDTGCELEFTQVPCQWYQADKNHIVFLTRKPERQWKRGISLDNTNLIIPASTGEYGVSIKPTVSRITQALIPGVDTGAFNGMTPIVCGLWSKYFAWAVNSVWVKDTMIGKVDHGTKEITLNYPQFQQELRDALIRSNSTYTVKV